MPGRQQPLEHEKRKAARWRKRRIVYNNDEHLDNLSPADPNGTTTGGQWLECLLHSAQVKRGENRVELVVKKRDEPMQTPLVLDAVQLHVHHCRSQMSR